jgi:TfoX/Sxy family transcriptional regulator of competence genes
MASDQKTADFVLDQLRGAGTMTAKRMFGEYGLYCDDKIVALLSDNQLFVKPTEAGREFAKGTPEAPPYPGAKPYLSVQDRVDDREWLTELVRITAAALPKPAPKKVATKKRKGA